MNYKIVKTVFVFLLIGLSMNIAFGDNPWCNETIDELQSYFDFVDESLGAIDLQQDTGMGGTISGEISGWRERYFDVDGNIKWIYTLGSSLWALWVSAAFQNPLMGVVDFFDYMIILRQPPGVFRDWKKLDGIDNILQEKQVDLVTATNAYRSLGWSIEDVEEKLDVLDDEGLYSIIDSSRFTSRSNISYISFLSSLNANTKFILRWLIVWSSYESFCVDDKWEVRDICKWDGWFEGTRNANNTRWYYIKESVYSWMLEQFSKLDDCDSVDTDMVSFSENWEWATDSWSDGWEDTNDAIGAGLRNLWKLRPTSGGAWRDDGRDYFGGSSIETDWFDIQWVESQWQSYIDQAKDPNTQPKESQLDSDSDQDGELTSNISRQTNQFKQNMASTMDNVLDIQSEMFGASGIDDPSMVTMQMPLISQQIYASMDRVWDPNDNDSILYYLKEACETQCSNMWGICTYY